MSASYRFSGLVLLFLVSLVAYCWFVCQSDTTTALQNPRDAVVVDVYIESLCIDSKLFVLNELIPVYNTLGPNVMDLNLVVFGNAQIASQSSDGLVCQHGQAECDANSFEQCAVDVFGDARALPFIGCLFEQLPMGHRDDIYDPSIFAFCARHSAVDWIAVNECHDDPERSWALQYDAYQETPSYHKYVPWVEINKSHIYDEGKVDLLSAICDAYEGTSLACSGITRLYKLLKVLICNTFMTKI